MSGLVATLRAVLVECGWTEAAANERARNMAGWIADRDGMSHAEHVQAIEASLHRGDGPATRLIAERIIVLLVQAGVLS